MTENFNPNIHVCPCEDENFNPNIHVCHCGKNCSEDHAKDETQMEWE